MYSQRGLDSKQEQKTSQLLRDTRTFGQKFSDFFNNPQNVSVGIFVLALGSVFFSEVADLLWLLITIGTIVSLSKNSTLPYRMPLRAKTKDFNDCYPGTSKPKMSGGIYHFGNERRTNKELWFTNEDMRTHVLIFGATGSGKTQTLISIAYNALVQASGFIYVDGKGDNTIYSQIFGMVRSMGREDDMLTVNFMTGARDIVGPQKKKISNTLNPFAKGSSSMLTQLVVSMMDSSSSGSNDGDMWKGRAIAFVEALMKVLVYMRDSGYILLDANSIRNYFPLDRIENMVEGKVFIRDGQYNISMENVPELIMQPIRNYLFTLPGYNPERRGKQVSQVFEQHGYITMQLTRVFTSLADTYGHILRVPLAEVDFKDIILNRRILVVLLPALEKSPDELSNLGKVIVSSLRTMLASGLGDEVEGTYDDLVKKKPTNAKTPYLCILDEYGYYAVKGFAVVPAQARSLGFSVVFAGQDLPAFQKASKEEAASIGANTNIKICMKLEDPTETWDFFNKTAGEAYVTQVENFQSNSGSVSVNYQDTRSAKVEKRARIDLQDLKDQREGEAHMFFRSTIIRFNTFYANPADCKKMRLTSQIRVGLPKDDDLYKLVKGIESFEKVTGGELPALEGTETEVYEEYNNRVEELISQGNVTPVEASLQWIVKRHDELAEAGEAPTSETLAEEGDDNFDVATDRLDIFMGVQLTQMAQEVLAANASSYERPILREQEVSKGFVNITRAMGGSDAEAQLISEEIVKDIHKLTEYTKPRAEIPAPDDVAGHVKQLIDLLKKQEE